MFIRIRSKKARQRQIELAGTRPNTLEPIDHKVNNNVEKGRVNTIVAETQGLSPTTYKRAKTIIKYGTKEQKEKLRKGKSTVNKEYTKIKKDQKKEELKSIKTNIELPPEKL